MNTKSLQTTAQYIRACILRATTTAGSGHATSSLSATDLMTALMFGGFFRYDVKNPQHPNNDRLIFSKGHAAPLLYALWHGAGAVSEEELLTLRQFGSRLEGHPTMNFPYAEAATGSLGQGLSIGLGMALNAKYLDTLPYRTFVLLGDSELAEGSNWEAMQLAAWYKLDNLIGIIDVNRLGQRGETLYGHDVHAYKKRIAAFGWEAIVVNGHRIKDIAAVYAKAIKIKGRPVMIIAKTVKGKGVKLMENKNGWHGQALNATQLERALTILKPTKIHVPIALKKPQNKKPRPLTSRPLAEIDTTSMYAAPLATREAYGHALVELFPKYPNIVVLDAEVSNSTFAATFKKTYPKHFFEMFIAEQNMVGVAVGLAQRGKIPFVSTFAAFFSRAADQIRMSPHSQANVKFVGSHCGVSIGADGPSQMGLEDIALFRAIPGSVVLYPADHVAEEKLTSLAAEHKGLVYIRTTRAATAPIYKPSTKFSLGGSHTLKSSSNDVATILTAGITLYEALKAYEELQKSNIAVRIIDMYSIKPLDIHAIAKACKETKALIVVEDHYPEGGLYEAICGSGVVTRPTYSLAVRKVPRSGKPEELLDYEGISAKNIVSLVQKISAP